MIIIIPGWLISLVTFPGVVIHEIAHRLFCDLTQTPVYRVTYFTILNDEHSGCVIHHKTARVRHSLLIALGPLLINSVVCMMLTIYLGTCLLMPWTSHQNHPLIIIGKFLISWVGISAGLHAIPSNTDLNNIQKSDNLIIRYTIICMTYPLRIFNVQYLGLILRALYTGILATMIPFSLMMSSIKHY